MEIKPCSAWGVAWYSKNRLDGVTQYIIHQDLVPKLFKTRKLAREWINNRFGYIRHRKDLRNEPHGWRLPRPIKLTIMPKENQ